MTLRLELTLPATAQVDAGERAILYESPDQCGSVSGFWRCRVSRGQEGSGRGDTHSQISLEVTNCQLSLHAARVPGRRPVTVARACAARLAPICSALHFRPPLGIRDAPGANQQLATGWGS